MATGGRRCRETRWNANYTAVSPAIVLFLPRVSVFFKNIYSLPFSRCIMVTGADKQTAKSNYLACDSGGYLAPNKQPEMDVHKTNQTIE